MVVMTNARELQNQIVNSGNTVSVSCDYDGGRAGYDQSNVYRIVRQVKQKYDKYNLITYLILYYKDI